MTHEEILTALYEDTLVGNAPAVMDGVRKGLDEGLEPEKMLYDALIPSLEEVGARFEPQEGLILSAALYQLDRTNTRSPGPTPGTVVQTGEQRSRGVEIEATGRIRSDWFVTGGYSYQEAEILSQTSACNPVGRTCEVPLVPRHTASAWTRYDFSGAFGVGLGVRHQSESFASISNAVVLPAYTRFDAGLFFRPAPQVQAQLNFENLLGEDYFSTAHNDNNISTGAPRSVRLTVRFGF